MSYEMPFLKSWTSDGWFDKSNTRCKFPRMLRRGEEIQIELHVKATEAWAGVLSVFSFREGDCVIQSRKPFRVDEGASRQDQ